MAAELSVVALAKVNNIQRNAALSAALLKRNLTMNADGQPREITADEIDAAMRRAHILRAQAFHAAFDHLTDTLRAKRRPPRPAPKPQTT